MATETCNQRHIQIELVRIPFHSSFRSNTPDALPIRSGSTGCALLRRSIAAFHKRSLRLTDQHPLEPVVAPRFTGRRILKTHHRDTLDRSLGLSRNSPPGGSLLMLVLTSSQFVLCVSSLSGYLFLSSSQHSRWRAAPDARCCGGQALPFIGVRGVLQTSTRWNPSCLQIHW